MVLVFFVAGCVTAPKTKPPPPPSEVSVQVNESARILEESKSLIETGMLDSLVKARKLIVGNNLVGTEQGRRLDYVASRFMGLVYPYYGQTDRAETPPKASIFPSIVSSVKAGRIPDITEENTSFFTLMFSAAAVFYTRKPDVLDRCQEIAAQLETFSKDNLYAKLVEAAILEKRGDTEQSFTLYSQIVDRKPDCYPAQLGIAGVYVQRRNFASAAGILEDLHAAYPDGKDISNLLVETYLDMAQIEKANSLLEEVLSRDPDDVDLALQRARLLLLSGQVVQAGKLVSIFESKKGETSGSLRLRVVLLMHGGFLQKAEKLLKKGLARYPGDLSLQISYGKLLLQMKQFSTAESYLTEKVSEHKDDPELLKLLVTSYMKQHLWNKALPLVERLVRLDSSRDVLRYAVEILYEQGETKRALAYNTRLLSEADPTMEDYYYRVVLLLRQGKKTEALTELNGWLASTDRPDDRSLLLYYMSLCTDVPDKKKDYLQKSLFENLQNLKALIALADLYDKQGEYRKAYRYLKQASLMDPENKAVREQLRVLEKKLK